MRKFAYLLILLITIPLVNLSGTVTDSDGDGIRDEYETDTGYYQNSRNTGTDSRNPDSDGDGTNDGYEVEAGSNPLDAGIAPSYSKISNDINLSNLSDDSRYPSILWRNQAYTVSWVESHDAWWTMYFGSFASSGETVGAALTWSAGSGVPSQPEQVWTNSNYSIGFVYNDGANRVAYLSRFPPFTKSASVANEIIPGGLNPSALKIIWTGTEYGVAWESAAKGGEGIYFTRFDREGIKKGDDILVVEGVHGAQNPSLVWNGSGYALCWEDHGNDNGEIRFVLLDSEGKKIKDDIRISSEGGFSSSPKMIWNGEDYAVVWQENSWGRNDIYFTKLSEKGDALLNIVKLSDGSGNYQNPFLTWIGLAYGVTWVGVDKGGDRLLFAMMDRMGARIGPILKVMESDDAISNPSLAWSDAEFGIVWTHAKNDNGAIYFARLAVDMDGDGLTDGTEQNIGANPLNWDSDGDGMSDGWEYNTCLNPLVNDAQYDYDNDGQTNIREYQSGSDPCKADAPNGADEIAGNDHLPNFRAGKNYGKPSHAASETNSPGRPAQSRPMGELRENAYFDPRAQNAGTGAQAGNKANEEEKLPVHVGSEEPVIAWNGQGYGVIFTKVTNMKSYAYFVNLDRSGRKISEEKLVTEMFNVGHPQMVWTGKEYGVVWRAISRQGIGYVFARLDLSGNKIGKDIWISTRNCENRKASIAWTGSKYGIVWEDIGAAINFQLLDASGARIGDEIRLNGIGEAALFPSMVWNGSEFGIVWVWQDRHYDINEIHFAKVNSEGEKLGQNLTITKEKCTSIWAPSIAYDGRNYAVLWKTSCDNRIKDANLRIAFARFTSDGMQIGKTIGLDIISDILSFVWTGENYVISHSRSLREGADDLKHYAYLSQLDRQGNLVDSRKVARLHNCPDDMSLIYTGSVFAGVWHSYYFIHDKNGKELYYAHNNYFFTTANEDINSATVDITSY